MDRLRPSTPRASETLSARARPTRRSGSGGSQIGGPVSTGDPRRNPIGFAPPADPVAEPRFRTELSFRRHHELPRASTTPVFPEDGAQSSWQSPEQVGSAEVDVDQVDAVDRSTLDQVDAVEEPVTELPVAEETVPFFKREISFRRRRRTPPRRSWPRKRRTTSSTSPSTSPSGSPRDAPPMS